MQIPPIAKELIDLELCRLINAGECMLPAEKRLSIYRALGPSIIFDKRNVQEGEFKRTTAPVMSTADCMRARVALVTGKKVAVLWPQACRETDANLREWQNEEHVCREEYLNEREKTPIERISIRTVPREFLPFHILNMAEMALRLAVSNWSAFRIEANECWELYGRPEMMERECFIKCAAQDALYEALGWINFNPGPPAENAILAFAGIFEGNDFDSRRGWLDEKKQHEFWVWWLSKAIPDAIVESGA